MGFKKGLILELASLIGLFLGIYGSLKFSSYTADQLQRHFEIMPEWIGILSFILTFTLIVLAVFIIAKMIDKALKIVALGLVNRLLGLLFGMVKYAVILSCLVFVFENINSKYQFVDEEFKDKSYLYQPLTLTLKPVSALLEEVSFSSYDSLMQTEPNLQLP